MKITLQLSPAGIEKAQKELQSYKQQMLERINLFVERLAEYGANVAEVRFSEALYDGFYDVSVKVESDGSQARIIASGETVLFIEFGTGISYPEHPSGLFKHGTYGQGKGANPGGWVYVGDPGTGGHYLRDGVYRTRGNPPAMAMWNSVESMAAAIEDLWKEVMSGD